MAGAGGLHAQVTRPHYGRVVGVVIDSLHNTPLAHADVQIEGTARIAHSDGDGNFHFDSVPAGPSTWPSFTRSSIRWASRLRHLH